MYTFFLFIRPVHQASTSINTRRTPVPAVPDDWDAEDDDEEVTLDPQQIWEDAYVHSRAASRSTSHGSVCRNTKSPMPQLISTQTTLPPPAAFQAPIRILKRAPSSTPSNASSPSPSPGPGTFAERSARYNAARERIFADGKASEGRKPQEASGEGVTSVVRNPRGPGGEAGESGADGGEQRSKGFGRRRGKGNGGPEASRQANGGALDQVAAQR
ncbi:hypothetical protein BV25DRAFT_1831298 [Artomyces pyxidatus]|uniref:Uncharacterized protein n=1 Tax=Artomyces pyxidatus TaxID=48021 RepID=A0ACB8SMI7_9AGAM|nr:hypothetical protein BV25DRAFT_1831298 [Artomyces pyxidatus]